MWRQLHKSQKQTLNRHLQSLDTSPCTSLVLCIRKHNRAESINPNMFSVRMSRSMSRPQLTQPIEQWKLFSRLYKPPSRQYGLFSSPSIFYPSISHPLKFTMHFSFTALALLLVFTVSLAVANVNAAPPIARSPGRAVEYKVVSTISYKGETTFHLSFHFLE